MDGRGWHNETARHSLASRGIRTRAIVNPVADPKWYQEERYGPGESSVKGPREFRGSAGLSNVTLNKVVDWVLDSVILINQYLNEEGVKDFNVEVEAIYLVGSRVSGFYIGESDLDVIVRFKGQPLHMKSRYLFKLDGAVEDAQMTIRGDPAWWLTTEDDEYIGIDVVSYSWEGPEEGSPYLKIWEAL